MNIKGLGEKYHGILYPAASLFDAAVDIGVSVGRGTQVLDLQGFSA